MNASALPQHVGADVYVSDSALAGRIRIRVTTPDGDRAALTPSTLRRVFGARAFSRDRRARLQGLVQFHALYGEAVVGVAAYSRQDDRVVVVEYGCDRTLTPVARAATQAQLMAAVEVAALAGGARLLLVALGPHCGTATLQRLGYRVRPSDTRTVWLEKVFA